MCAASSAGLGGEGHAWLLGTGIELLRELLRVFGLDHDSYEQDTYNQAVGRQLATQYGAGMTSFPLIVHDTTQAYLQGRMRVGPERQDVWLPWAAGNDFHHVHRHENRDWIPEHGVFESAPQHWIEAVDCGPNGLARGSGARPSTPLPAG